MCYECVYEEESAYPQTGTHTCTCPDGGCPYEDDGAGCCGGTAGGGKCGGTAGQKTGKIPCGGCQITHTVSRDGTLRLYSCGEAGNYFIVRDHTHNTVVAGDGSIRFTGSGTVRVWVRSRSTGQVVDCYRITAVLLPGNQTRLTVVHYCNCDGQADAGGGNGTVRPMSIELCDANGVRLSESPCRSWIMEIGEQYSFGYRIRNQTGNPEVKWSVSAPNILAVNSEGVVYAKDDGYSKLRVELPETGSSSETEIEVFVGDYLVTAAQMRQIGWNEAKTSREAMADINRTLKKFEITTTERIRHFLAQCFVETGKNNNKDEYLEKGTKFDRGGGAIQMTNGYEYQAFATYKILEKYPFLDGRHLPAAHYYDYLIDAMYKRVLESAKNEGVSSLELKIYTDIYDIGAPYVAKNFPWESAGYYWQAHDLNQKTDDLTPGRASDVDEISKVVNNKGDYAERRDAYVKVCAVIQ